MKMTAAVMFEQGRKRPFTESKPLEIETVDLEGPGENEVLVEIAAAGLCHSDLSAIKGVRPRAMPAVVGHEAAGIVRETGKGVKSLKAGDHVVMLFVASCGSCRYCTAGRPNLCESSWQARAEGTLQGGARRLSLRGSPLNHYSGISAFAQYAVVSERSLIAIPKSVALPDAAIMGCAVITGVGAVLNSAGAVAGKRVGIVGMGGVGLAALLGAVLGKAERIVAVDVHADKLELASRLGATDTFLATDPECAAKIRENTGGGLDYVFEMAGSIPATKLAYSIAGRGGEMICAGLPPASATFEYAPSALVADERVIKGSYMGSSVPERDIPNYIEHFLAGRLPIDRLRTHDIGFGELNLGFDRLDEGVGVRQVLIPHLRGRAGS